MIPSIHHSQFAGSALGAHELHPSYADVHTQRSSGVGIAMRGDSILRTVPPHIPAVNPTAAVGISSKGSALTGPYKIPCPRPGPPTPAERELGMQLQGRTP